MTRSLAELLVGRVLAERYLVEALIGEGGMSLVYRGLDQRLGRPVAVKVVSLPGGAGGQSIRERFRREAAAAASIPPHPNVVQVYDYGTDAVLDLDFIVMELLRGRDLKAALRNGPPAPPEALRILLESARGLAAGHRAGIVHRDVKPANLFLVGAGRLEVVKILDFGIAKALEPEWDAELTQAGQIPHSPAYASPEQLDPERQVGPASDVFQLGLVAYELLAGERPFDDAQRARLQGGESPDPPARGRWSSVPAPLQRVIARALRADPADRYPDAAAFAEALAAAADDDATRVLPPADVSPDPHDATVLAPRPSAAPPSPPPAPPRQRRPGGAVRRWAPLGAVTLLAVLMAVWALRGGPAEAPTTGAPVDLGELDQEFRPLLLDAARELREGGGPAEGLQAATEVERVILDLNQSWVRGELDRHLSHYAERVDFYRADDARRSRVRRERGEALERYPDREITIERSAINFPEPGRAVALVDKSWRFGGPRGRWEGSGRQELILERREGRWRVVSERDLEVYRQERSDG